jgi:signal transduction histidine kinase
MRFEIKSFRTRVARRIFFLFVVCALLPVTTMAGVSYVHVRSQLMDQSTQRLREENKAVAVSIYERLLFLRSEMRTAAALLQADTGEALGSRNSGAGPYFEWIALSRGGTLQGLAGQAIPLPELTAEQRRHLAGGKALLLIEPGTTDPFLMALQVEAGEDGGGLLFGAISGDYLWEAAERRPPGTEVFVMGDARQMLYSSLPEDAGFLRRAAGQVGDAHSGLFEWKGGSRPYLASYTSLFISTNFHYPKWTVVVSQPKNRIFAPMASFKIVFPVLVVLTVGMVFILSVNLIHRSLGPIETLKEATEHIAAGDYSRPVNIHSGDEFETLAESFNVMRQKIEESQNLLVRTAKMATMGQMSGGIIHEIKQPLSAIHGQIQLLQLNPNLTDDEKERMNAVLEAVERMNTTMGRFTAFSHMGEGNMQKVYLPDVIERIHKLLDHQLMRKGISCRIENQEKVPSIEADLQGMQQIISNLMINAVHAIEEKGGPDPWIAVRTRAENGHVVLEVEDTGCGMPEDVAARIFDPFFTTKEAEKGTGLGMAIVETIVHQHGAVIDVESRVGVGTCFTIRFPQKYAGEKNR